MGRNKITDNPSLPLDIDGLRCFLSQVAANNSREWLAANRAEYDRLRAQWLASLDRVCASMASWLPGMATQSGRSSTYRFYRDTRFSADKSPLKTFFSADFAPWGRSVTRAGYYLQIGLRESPDNGVWGGIYCPEPAQLRKLRKAIVDNIEEFESIINEPQLAALYPGWCGQRLKTAPKGWDRDHPQIELLRLKDYGKFSPLDDDFFHRPDWPEQVSERLRVISPLVDFLNYSLDE